MSLANDRKGDRNQDIGGGIGDARSFLRSEPTLQFEEQLRPDSLFVVQGFRGQEADAIGEMTREISPGLIQTG